MDSRCRPTDTEVVEMSEDALMAPNGGVRPFQESLESEIDGAFFSSVRKFAFLGIRRVDLRRQLQKRGILPSTILGPV
eukprot:CAMPEP_0116557784 /NCGR_PEP_ID=MMETSP0397-20121206/9440_1 /TAXON_ID=216820 /ORGANISM="Cyclophora tenuis, Strain ECT3854" /LENGTH=77 /DNA_ID=CAMNT_0004083295 /DNA_START=472 /DNA_END=702 /DNA_ORIENTATION=-